MRPPKLAPLFATVRSLKGVGPKVEGLLSKLVRPRHEGAHARLIDLVWHLPVGVIDRPVVPRIAEAKIGELATLEVTVAAPRAGGGGRGVGGPLGGCWSGTMRAPRSSSFISRPIPPISSASCRWEAAASS